MLLRLATAILLASSAVIVNAQVTTAMPGGTLLGLIRNADGDPLSDVSISLVGEPHATRTDSTGRFALRGIPAGAHTALFRRIGYRSVEYRWSIRSGVTLDVSVLMSVAPRQLERVVVEVPTTSRRRGTSTIGGKVTDSAGVPIAGADVRLLGSGLSTMTDSSGLFAFRMLAAGSYIVRARRHGLQSANYVMQILDDDAREITLKQFGLPKKLNPRDAETASGYGVADIGFDAFDRRSRNGSGPPVLGPGDLFRANRAPLNLVLQEYLSAEAMRLRRTSVAREGSGSSEGGDCLLLDGKRAVYQPLRTFTSVEVQLVEAIRAHSTVDPFVVSQMEGLTECRGSIERHPTYFVLWTRSMR